VQLECFTGGSLGGFHIAVGRRHGGPADFGAGTPPASRVAILEASGTRISRSPPVDTAQATEQDETS